MDGIPVSVSAVTRTTPYDLIAFLRILYQIDRRENTKRCRNEQCKSGHQDRIDDTRHHGYVV